MNLVSTLVRTCRAAVGALARELAAWRPARDRAIFSAEAVLSVALAVALANALHLSYTWWAAISGFAVMQTRFAASAERAVHRVIGTVIGAVLGAVAGPLIGDRPWLFVPALGVWIGCHVQSGSQVASYVGRQFTIAFIMVFVQDHHWANDPMPALLRLSGILSGIAVLAAVMLATRRLKGDFILPSRHMR